MMPTDMKKIRLLKPFMKYLPDDEIEVTPEIAAWLVGKKTAEYVKGEKPVKTKK